MCSGLDACPQAWLPTKAVVSCGGRRGDGWQQWDSLASKVSLFHCMPIALTNTHPCIFMCIHTRAQLYRHIRAKTAAEINLWAQWWYMCNEARKYECKRVHDHTHGELLHVLTHVPAFCACAHVRTSPTMHSDTCACNLLCTDTCLGTPHKAGVYAQERM